MIYNSFCSDEVDCIDPEETTTVTTTDTTTTESTTFDSNEYKHISHPECGKV